MGSFARYFHVTSALFFCSALALSACGNTDLPAGDGADVGEFADIDLDGIDPNDVDPDILSKLDIDVTNDTVGSEVSKDADAGGTDADAAQTDALEGTDAVADADTLDAVTDSDVAVDADLVDAVTDNDVAPDADLADATTDDAAADAMTDADAADAGTDASVDDIDIVIPPTCAVFTCGANAACAETDAGPTCVCIPGFTGDPSDACADIDACATNPCGTNAVCTDLPTAATDAAGRTCACNFGFDGDPAAACTDVNACEAFACGSNATCTDLPAAATDASGRTCACNFGFGGSASTGCTEIDACVNNPCASNATCTDLPAAATDASGRTCACNFGFTGDGETCTDIDACTNNPCGADATCTDLPAASADANGRTCTCNSGYSGDGITCVDIDECASGKTVSFAKTNGSELKDCITPDICIARGNKYSLYNASVDVFGPTDCADVKPTGTQWALGTCDAPTTAFGYFLSESFANCSTGNNIIGKAGCLYLPAYDTYYDIKFSVFANSAQGAGFAYERTTSGKDNTVCPAHATCSNEIGSYSCACKAGFEKDTATGKCIDINACVNHPCGVAALCTDITAAADDETGRTCACPVGFSGDPTATCTDIDECAQSQTVNFVKTNYGTEKDCIAPDICITRGDNQSIFNAVVETTGSNWGDGKPTGTLWGIGACGTPSMAFTGFLNPIFLPNNPPGVVGHPNCLYLPAYDTYFDISFTSWTSENQGGGFAYTRTNAGNDNIICGAHATCTNTPGAYDCPCTSGFAKDSATGKCLDVDACLLNPCAANATCTDLPGAATDGTGRTCACNELFKGDGYTSCDADACLSAPCDPAATCTDLPGNASDTTGRTCSCPTGYTGDGEKCLDINECLNTSICSPKLHCANLPGSYACTVTTCADIKLADPTALTGFYNTTFLPDDPTGVDIWCDMDFQGGGWTLIMRGGPTNLIPEGVPSVEGDGYLPVWQMEALAARSHDIAFREGNPANFARTNYDGVTELTPILNLRQGFSPYRSPNEYNAAIWTGGGVNATPNDHLWFGCAGDPADYVYPKTLYWACNNGNGMHWLSSYAGWFTGNSFNLSMELWFK